MAEKKLSEMTREELMAVLATQGIEAAEAPMPDEEAVDIQIDGNVGVLEPGLYPSEVIALTTDKSKAGNDKLVFKVRITEGEFVDSWGEVHASPAIAARILRVLGLKLDLKDKRLKFNPKSVIGAPCKVKWTEGQGGFIRPDAIYAHDYEEQTL
jgi:hypothetical protein